ncbi:MAG: hypothetical protein KatS3mg076_0998 [Candidatus Binatia bacterium]|nr:MAG: hypothetical protein KatS3mg076_0998 [Candidatus Binatia bacterium]
MKDRGIAIPAVLVALVALTALALAVTYSSRNEVVTTALERWSVESLQAADAALNFALGLPASFADTADQPAVNLKTHGLPLDATVAIDYDPPPRLPPPGLDVSARKLRAYHFLLDARGYVRSKAAGEPDSTTALEMEVAKLGPVP